MHQRQTLFHAAPRPWRSLRVLLLLGLTAHGLSGCNETLPKRDTVDGGAAPAGTSTSATAAPAGADDEPLPWPLPGDDPPRSQEAAAPRPLYGWNGDGRRVTRVIIDTDKQEAYFYNGQERIGWSTVATGTKTYPTPTGEFEVMEKVADKRSNLYGRIYNKHGVLVKSNARKGRDPIPPGGRFVGAKMPNFLRMTYDGVGLHAGPIPRPGSPASHGCIRMPEQLAATVFQRIDPGTPVSVVGSGPSYGNYAAQMRRKRAEERARLEAERLARQTSGTDALGVESAEPTGSDARASAGAATDRQPAGMIVEVASSAPPMALGSGAAEPSVSVTAPAAIPATVVPAPPAPAPATIAPGAPTVTAPAPPAPAPAAIAPGAPAATAPAPTAPVAAALAPGAPAVTAPAPTTPVAAALAIPGTPPAPSARIPLPDTRLAEQRPKPSGYSASLPVSRGPAVELEKPSSRPAAVDSVAPPAAPAPPPPDEG